MIIKISRWLTIYNQFNSWRKRQGIADIGLYSLLFGLLLLGRRFTGPIVFEAICIHDFILAILALLCLIRHKFQFQVTSLLIVFGVAVAYLLVSLLWPRYYDLSEAPATWIITLRQFALFGYGIGYYILMISSYSSIKDKIVFFELFGVLGFAVNLLYCANIIFTGRYDFSTEFHYYFSQGAVVASFLGVTAVLLNRSVGFFVKVTVVLLGLMMSSMTGHVSAVAVTGLICLVCIWNASSKLRLRLLTVILSGLVVVGVFFLPQFWDANASWRWTFWSNSMKIVLLDNWGIFGEGFGVPYDPAFLESGLFRNVAYPEKEVFLSPGHNSFVTIFFCIGLLPGLLLFSPYRVLFARPKNLNKRQRLFLQLGLAAITIWASFHVFLELPHASGVYWALVGLGWHVLKADPHLGAK